MYKRQVANPDKNARTEILKVHARNKKFAPDVDFTNIAQRTPGFSGAELENVLNEMCIRDRKDIEMCLFQLVMLMS